MLNYLKNQLNCNFFPAITLRKIGKSTDEICQAVYSYDLGALSLEYVEMLPRFIPNEMELKAFKNYERSGKSFEELADEDKFMWLVNSLATVKTAYLHATVMIVLL